VSTVVLVAALLLIAAGVGVVVRRARTTAANRKRELAARANRQFTELGSAFTAFPPDAYVAGSEYREWRSAFPWLADLDLDPSLTDYLPVESRTDYRRWIQFLRGEGKSVDEHNERYIEATLVGDADAFDRVESYPLTLQQRRAIITNDNTNLVIAGAGTGKTSTIVGKVDFLVRHGLARSDDVLLLAYNRSAADELKNRIDRLLGYKRVSATTFHALGLRIVGEATGRKPSLSKLAEDDTARLDFIRGRIRRLMESPATRRQIVDLFSRLLDETELPTTSGTQTLDEQIRAERAKGLRALDGTRLKSRQEVQIANWLTLHGIRWDYEAPYQVATATASRRQYTPDFFLPDHDIYLEHFGVSRSGRTAPGIDNRAYTADMNWKVQTHQANRTTLVATYSYQFDDGTVFTQLEQQLLAHGVFGKPLTQVELDDITSRANKPFNDFIALIGQFLVLFKGSGLSQEHLQQRAKTSRDRVFVGVFLSIFDAYQAELERTKTIDFDDMINLAREAIQSGRWTSGYRYVVVDEFQDISNNRMGLIEDLLKRVRHARLFAVGDDWQSIYRFAGSDVGIITHIDRRLGAYRRVDLDTAFRYGQKLLDASSTFIMQNPNQLRKRLAAHSTGAPIAPICVVLYEQRPNGATASDPLQPVLQEITRQLATKGGTVRILGRYRFNRPDLFDQHQAQLATHNIELDYLTAHRSKGTEADYVIVAGLESGEFGFPPNVSDDPVMRLVLTEPEAFPYAEERRLFYVALTRTRNRVYVVAPADRASPFIQDELLSEKYAPFVEVVGEVSERHRCPECQGKTIKRRQGQYGSFWACTNYPLCTGKLTACPRCKAGGLVPINERDLTGRYRCTDCAFTTARCPKCHKGFLVPRTGKYGDFTACTDWRGGDGCDDTRSGHA
jgi:DNA helicase-4